MPQRLPIPEDYQPSGLCLSCDEWDDLSKLVKLDGNLYHEDGTKTPQGFICQSGVLRCSWCGAGVDQGEAEQDGKDYYHADCLFLMRMADKPAVQALIQAEATSRES